MAASGSRNMLLFSCAMIPLTGCAPTELPPPLDETIDTSVGHVHSESEPSYPISLISVSGGVLPTVFPSSSVSIGSYVHGTYVNFGGGTYRSHLGVDVLESPVASPREPVYAMAEGTVALVSYSASLGNHIIIRHRGIGAGGNDLYSLYLHLDQVPLVSQGAAVTKSQQIGVMGRTGTSANSIYHTHFEIRAFSTTLWPSFGNIYGPVGCNLASGLGCSAQNTTDYANQWRDPTQFTVPSVPAPTNVRASDGTYSNRVYVTWTPPNRDGLKFTVSRATCSTCQKTSLITNLTTSTFSDVTARPGTTYYYFVAALSTDTPATTRSGSDSGFAR